MDTALLPNATLAEFYRLAVLLTGSAKDAEEMLSAVLVDAEAHVAQLRSETSRQAWIASKLRDRCKSNNRHVPVAPRLVREGSSLGGTPEILDIEAFLLAQRFHALPEPERSALAFFYIELFSIEEIAGLLKMTTTQLAETLGHARELLAESLCEMKGTSPDTP